MGRRKGIDRRQQQISVMIEKRKCTDRRLGLDRRESQQEIAIDNRAKE